MNIKPRRSVLYMPGSSTRALEKAATLAADALILDLEDAVAPDSKDIARHQVCDAVRNRKFAKKEVAIRINGLETAWGGDDLTSALAAVPDAILVPKVNDAADINRVIEKMSAAESRCALWVMIETSLAIFNVQSIAACASSLACLVLGTNDLIKELRAMHTPAREALSTALNLSVMAARSRGLAVIDGVFNDIADIEGFRAACHQGRSMGFDGKTLIHPSQIADCNRIYSPAPDQVAEARNILAAFALPENQGKGAISLNGRMVERLHAEIARETVVLHEAIEALTKDELTTLPR